ncbi:MAG TPA: hypothetical protein VG871_22725, partial [Vicinamibacterales bacterium]|nr:hypothetical protein [Vicinamibacterales bacterium]
NITWPLHSAALVSLGDVACRWWRAHRAKGQSEAAHLDAPLTGFDDQSADEAAMALIAAKLVELGWNRKTHGH